MLLKNGFRMAQNFPEMLNFTQAFGAQYWLGKLSIVPTQYHFSFFLEVIETLPYKIEAGEMY